MKKLAAIILGLLLLFNWAGYRMVFSYLESHSSRQLNMRLDNNHYQEEDLVTIKLPVDELPYYTNSPIFERVKGEVTIGGMKYQYVERRIYNDSLEMRCIPNAQSTHLTNARDAFFQLVNDLQHTSSSGKPVKQQTALKSTLSDYLLTEAPVAFQPTYTERKTTYNLYLATLAETFRTPAKQPPDAGCLS